LNPGGTQRTKLQRLRKGVKIRLPRYRPACGDGNGPAEAPCEDAGFRIGVRFRRRDSGHCHVHLGAARLQVRMAPFGEIQRLIESQRLRRMESRGPRMR
jgi:hypothetical protein